MFSPHSVPWSLVSLSILRASSLQPSRRGSKPMCIAFNNRTENESMESRTSWTGVPCSSISGPPSPVIFPIAAASSLTCGMCEWSWPGPFPSVSGKGFSSAVMCLLGTNRRHKGGWIFARATGNCERRGRGGAYRRKGNRGGILKGWGGSGVLNLNG